MLLFRHFEEKAEELEELKTELQGRVEDLEDETNHLKRQLLMESEAKNKLRQETSQLTAENMVCVGADMEGYNMRVCRKTETNCAFLSGL